MKTFDPARDGLGFLIRSMAAQRPGDAILEQEAEGRREVVARAAAGKAELPTDIAKESKEALEAAGVKFGYSVAGDPMFQHAELPAGWAIKGTDHSMYTKLVDEKGRERASIFYKAAFYDRSARLTASRRYSIQSHYNDDHKTVAVARVLDGDGSVVFESDRIAITDENKYDKRNKSTWEVEIPGARTIANQQCESWLAENKPDWRSLTAYWD